MANDLVVRFGGNIVFDVVNEPVDGVFRQFSGTFAASTGITRLQFDGRNDPDFPWADDICVATVASGTCGGEASRVVPEPATLILLGSALLGAGAWTRRKRSPTTRQE